MITVLGLTAGLLTTSCWEPQILRSYRTRSTGDISWAMIAALGSGIVLWLAYGVIVRDTSLIVANIATVLALGSLGYLKWRFDSRRSCEP